MMMTINKVETLNQNAYFVRSYRCIVFYENTQWFPQLFYFACIYSVLTIRKSKTCHFGGVLHDRFRLES